MRLYIYIFILLLLCIFPLGAQQERSESYIRISAPVSLAGALDEIESQTNYSFIYDAQVINLSEKVRKSLSGRTVFEILNLLFKNTEIVYTVMNDQIILNKKEAIIQMQQKLDGKVKGIVTDHKGEPIACVNVVEKGTRNGTITDMDGSFVLELPEEATLVFSYIGYRSREIEYEGQLSLNVQLDDDAQILDEVVVTALGIEKKESSLPYATQLITGGELVRAKDFNFMSTLSGKMAGLQINRTSAGLGSSSRVIIRGSRSASGNNQPLYVIDGVPILSISSEQALTTIGGTADAGNRDAGDGISNLNPDDIESLSVLKGASASALYGGQAANGVILIKTKKGKAGVRNIHFSSSLTVDQAISLPKFQNEFGRLEGAETCWGDRASLPVYDPVGDFFRTGITAINSLIFTAGNSHVQNYFSYANTTARGIVPKNNLSKHNFNLRESSSFFDDRLILEGQANLILQTIKGKPTVGGFYMNPLQGLYTFPRGMDMAPYKENFEVYNEKRNMNVQNWYTTITDFEQNPYWLVNRTENEDKRARVLALASASFKVTDWLTLQGRGNIDYVNDKYQQEIYASTSPGIAGENGRYIYYTYQTTLLYGDLMAKLNKSWDDFSLNAAIGTSITDTRTSALRLDSKTASLYYPNVFTIANINMSSSAYIEESDDARRQMQSFFAMAQLGYKESLYLDVTARNDWSSTLAFTERKSRGFFYPLVGLSWIIPKSFSMPSLISFGKVRASWSKVGNDIPLFVSNTVGHIAAGGIPQPNDTAPFGTLKPEMSSSFEIGTEWKFFDYRMDVDFTFYKTNTKNQLFSLPSSAGAAYKYYFVNAGNIQNMGVELTFGAVPILTNQFKWNTTLNFSRNKNEVKKLHDDLASFIQGDEGFSSSYTMRLVEGGSFGDIYGKAFERDKYGAIVYGRDGLPQEIGSGNTAKVGNCNPAFLLGWGNSFTYKDFSFYFLIDGHFGGDVLAQTQAVLDQTGVSKVSGEARTMGYVDLEGHHIYNIKGFYEQVGGRNGVTEYYMYDATNIRLRELSLGYTLPKRLLGRKQFVKKAELSFVARNLFFIYKKAPFDPDAVLSASNSNQGIDIFGIPTTRSVGFNVKLSF